MSIHNKGAVAHLLLAREELDQVIQLVRTDMAGKDRQTRHLFEVIDSLLDANESLHMKLDSSPENFDLLTHTSRARGALAHLAELTAEDFVAEYAPTPPHGA